MGIGKKARYLSAMVQKHGLTGLVVKYLERRNDREEQEYQRNWRKETLRPEEWEMQRQTRFQRMPLISVVVPAYETPEPFLRELVASLKQQSYENWQLCIGDGSVSDSTQRLLEQLSKEDDRITFCRLKENGGISHNTNAAIGLARGSYVGFMDHDDCLAPNALFEVVRKLNEEPECRVIYTDEDKIDASGEEHFRPHRKPDYNPELLRHYNYICHFVVVERELLEQVGCLRSAYDGSQDYDLLLRLSEQTDRFGHIDLVLYHWRAHSQSTAGSSLSKDYAYEAGLHALEDYVKRNTLPAVVTAKKGRQSYGVRYLPGSCSLSVIDIRNREQWEKLTGDEGAEEYVLLYDGARVKKLTARQQREMLGFTQVEKVGMVGVRLSTHGRLLSAGYVRKQDGTLQEQFAGLPVHFHGPFDRAVIPQNVAAVPLACVLIHKRFLPQLAELFASTAVENLPLALADQVRRAGYQVILDAEITLPCKKFRNRWS
ncbi:MAG: glycosyltransferase [Roseburia sp.]